MKDKKIAIVGFLGILCAAAMFGAVWYSLKFNDGRLVYPMDFGSYVFSYKDLPMILACIMVIVYFAFVFLSVFLHAAQKNNGREEGYTRKINPKLGFLGFFGFLGFLGFLTYPASGQVTPFVFFIFFGFFGFYYEGKMSGIFKDERFRENAVRAQLKAYKIGFTINFIALIVFSQGYILKNAEYTLAALIITLSLSMALCIFLGEYLLYHYDNDENEM